MKNSYLSIFLIVLLTPNIRGKEKTETALKLAELSNSADFKGLLKSFGTNHGDLKAVEHTFDKNEILRC